MAVNNVNIINGFAQHDTLCTQVVNMPDTIWCEMESYPYEMDSILSRISTYGVGMDDTSAIILIPLIIAVFAFSLPHIFSVRRSIDEKYNSESINKIFERENVNGCVRSFAFGAMLMLLFIALYCFVFELYDIRIANNSLFVILVKCALIVITVGFVASVCFYHNVGSQYLSSLQLVKLLNEYRKSPHEKDCFERVRRYNNDIKNREKVIENIFIQQELIEGFKDIIFYALKNGNKQTLAAVSEIIQEDMNLHAKYSNLDQIKELEVSYISCALIPHWCALYNSHSVSDRQGYSILMNLLISIINYRWGISEHVMNLLIKSLLGSFSFGEGELVLEYIKRSQYSYLQNVKDQLFLDTFNIEEKKRQEFVAKHRENSEYIRDAHFIMCALIVDRVALDSLLKCIVPNRIQERKHITLFPQRVDDVLERYFRICRMIDSKDYRYYQLLEKQKDVSETELKDMLAQISASLLLYLCNSPITIHKPIRKKDRLWNDDYGEKLLTQLRIQNNNSKGETNVLAESVEEYYETLKKLFLDCHYEGVINKKINDDFVADLSNAIYSTWHHTLNEYRRLYRIGGYYPEYPCLPLSVSHIVQNKEAYLENDINNIRVMYGLGREIGAAIKLHFEYDLLSVFAKMNKLVYNVSKVQLKDQIRYLIGDTPDDFIVFDCSGTIDVLYATDKLENGRTKFIDVDFYSIQILDELDISSFPMFPSKALLLIPKKSLPILGHVNYSIGRTVCEEVDTYDLIVNDASIIEDDRALVRVNFIPKYNLQYDKDSLIHVVNFA